MAAQHLEQRMTELERKVFGDLDKTAQYTKATDVILGFNSRLKNALADQDRAVMIMKRLDELEDCLDPLFAPEREAAAAGARVAAIIANEQQLRQLHQQLQQVDSLQKLLDSEGLRDVSALRGRLEAAALRQQEQARRQAALTAAAHQLTHHCQAAVDSAAEALLRAEQRLAEKGA